MFRALFLCRSEEKVALVTAHTGIPATTSLQECLDFGADFAVIAVDRPHIADVAEEWLDRGYPVLAETPIADSEEKLRRLWQRREEGCRIVCCEQYHRYPILAAGLKAQKKAGEAHRLCEGRNVALVFEKTSTRTRCALAPIFTPKASARR